MSIAPGTRLGLYEITALIGRGGMGEVYRAHDTRLGRDVAIKVLPSEVAADHDRLARFEREAQVLAALNHPNIAQIFGVEDSTGVPALVMELVDGPTLADRIAKGPIPLDEVLPIAKQIAEALEAAHEHGIIHRDLKPANIKVRPDGTVKVLDFGLAKAFDPSAGAVGNATMSPTLSIHATQAGIILGTAAYMSPEQARALPVDRRVDIWAFGCVVFEMLTGRMAFPGATVSDHIAAILEREPDWGHVPANTPRYARILLRRCLQKDLRKRLPHISLARLEIEEGPSAHAAVEPSASPTGSHQLRRWLPSALAVVVLAAAGLTLWMRSRTAVHMAPVRLSAALGVDARLVIGADGAAPGGSPAILSPDGAVLAFTARTSDGNSQLFVRPLSKTNATPLAGTDGARDPFFSPDGKWIAFFASRTLKKIAVAGGAAVTLAEAPDERGGAWSEDGTIAFMPGGADGLNLLRISSDGGTPQPFTTLESGEMTARWPQFLPGGRGVLYTHSRVGNYRAANLMVQPLPSGAPKMIQERALYGRYVSSGHILFARDGALFAAPFELERLQVIGPSVPVIEQVLVNPNSGGSQYDVSGNGILVYPAALEGARGLPLVWMDRNGRTTPLQHAAAAQWRNLSVSPNGDRIALEVVDGEHSDIWIYDVATDRITRLTYDRTSGSPVWTPDGRRVTFASRRDGKAEPSIYWQRTDGTGEAQRLTDSPAVPGSWHPNGRLLAFQRTRQSSDVLILRMNGDESAGWTPGDTTVFLDTPAHEMSPSFSPDGRWLAYTSIDTGQIEVYVRPFPRSSGLWQISTDGGALPTWSRVRNELFFARGGEIMVVPYSTDGDQFRAGKPAPWSNAHFAFPVTNASISRGFDLHPDGERFALAKADSTMEDRRDSLMFVLNFFDELRQLAPVTTR